MTESLKLSEEDIIIESPSSDNLINQKNKAIVERLKKRIEELQLLKPKADDKKVQIGYITLQELQKILKGDVNE